MKSLRSRPDWWKPERPEYHRNPLLQACAQAGMTADEALGELARAYANLEQTASRLATHAAPRFVLSSGDFTVIGPKGAL